jgi:hypothetical protein
MYLFHMIRIWIELFVFRCTHLLPKETTDREAPLNTVVNYREKVIFNALSTFYYYFYFK